jgi:nucleotide-binding universal stress UspA family protein
MELLSLHAVVVGVDGSAASLVAARLAAVEAARRGLALRVICTYPPPPVRSQAAEQRWQPHADAHRTGVELTDEIRAAHPGLPVDLVEGGGELAGTLVDQSRVASLVVVGTDDEAGLTGRSAATRVAEYAVCPTLVVRPAVAPGPVLVGLDGTERDVAAVPVAFEEASSRGVALDAVLIGDGSAETSRNVTTVWADKHPDVAVTYESAPAEALIALSAEAGLVVIGRGEATRPLVHRAGCPVLVVPGP